MGVSGIRMGSPAVALPRQVPPDALAKNLVVQVVMQQRRPKLSKQFVKDVLLPVGPIFATSAADVGVTLTCLARTASWLIA